MRHTICGCLLIPLGLLLLFFAACGSQATTSQLATSTVAVTTPTAKSSGQLTTTTSNTMLQTATSCPATGTGRAAVTTPLTLGHQQTIVYVYNTPHTAILRRYDVGTNQKTNILSIPDVQINDAQLSTDGQFIL